MNVAVQLAAEPARPSRAVPDFGQLIALARSRSPDDRQRLLLAVAALCDATQPGVELSPILSEIFLTLAGQAEREIRAVLADRLATAEWAPPALIHMLALDDIEIARPIIAASPLLKDDDLLRILVEATLEHQIEVARRPNLSGRVADAVIDRADAAVMTALAGNRSAQVSEDSLRRLIEHSRRIAGLRAPLTRHPALSDALATQLYAWVGEALRQSIADRFRIDEVALNQAVDRAVATRTAQWTSPPDIKVEDPAEVEKQRRLVDKLKSAGQLRAGFLVRALREQQLGLFEHALAGLGEFPLDQVRAAVRADSPEPLYLACSAVGIDRAVFVSMLPDLRKLTGGWPADNVDPPWTARPILRDSALREFRQHIAQARGGV